MKFEVSARIARTLILSLAVASLPVLAFGGNGQGDNGNGHQAPLVFAGPGFNPRGSVGKAHVNHWEAYEVLMNAILGQAVPREMVTAKPFTATFHLETMTPNVQTPGNPIVGGQLIIDAWWRFDQDLVVQPAIATITIDPGVFNSKTVTVHGTVPVPSDKNSEGFSILVFQQEVSFNVNPASAAQGQSMNTLIVSIEQ